MCAAAVLFLLCPPAHADTAADLQTIQGDGGSIAEWYNNAYANAGGACDAMCQALGNQLADQSAQAGTQTSSSGLTEAPEAAAGDDAAGLVADLGGGDMLAGIAAVAPEVVGAAAAGYAAYKIGSDLFGSPATPPDSNAASFNGPFYPAFTYEYFWGDCPTPLPSGVYCGTSYEADPDTGQDSDFTWMGANTQAANFAKGVAGALLENGSAGGAVLVSNAGANGTAAGCANAGFLCADQAMDGAGFAYVPQTYTPEPSTFAPTGTGGTPAVTPAPAVPADGSTVLSTLQANPKKYASLIHVMASAHQQAAQQGSGSGAGSTQTQTQTGGVTETDSETATFANPNPSTTATTGSATSTTSSPGTSTAPQSGTSTATYPGTTSTPQPQESTLTIPPINEGQTTASYVAELGEDGFTNVTTHTLTGDEVDLSIGPNDAAAVDPQAGTQAAAGTAIEVQGNPSDSPPSGSLPGAPAVPALPGISVPTVATPCKVFPFGVPCWASSQLQALSASPQAPSISLAIPSELGGGKWNIDLGDMFGFNFGSVMDIVRPVLLAASLLGVFVLLAGLAMGGTAPASSGSASGEE